MPAYALAEQITPPPDELSRNYCHVYVPTDQPFLIIDLSMQPAVNALQASLPARDKCVRRLL